MRPCRPMARRARAQLDCPVEGGQRLDVAVGGGEREAEIVMSPGIVRLELDGAAMAGDRLFRVLQILERITANGLYPILEEFLGARVRGSASLCLT